MQHLYLLNIFLMPNWLFPLQAYNYWLNDMYMDVRLPLPINSNPGMPMPPVRFTTVHDVARFAALLLSGIMMHKELLDRYIPIYIILYMYIHIY